MTAKFVLGISIFVHTIWALGGNSPTIRVSDQSNPYLDLSNKALSAALGDPTDPMGTLGIDFIIADEDPVSVTFTVSSSKTSVVPNSANNLIVSGAGTLRNLKIKAKAAGYATITISIKDKEGKSAIYVLKYAVSAAASKPEQHHYFTHLSSASTGLAVGSDYMWVGDDEYNELSLYNRKQSGMPVATFDPTPLLKLPEPESPEVDIEASCMSPILAHRCYWIGSMSNSKSGEQKPNRDRLFATDLSGAGQHSQLSLVGFTSLRSQIISWGDAHGYNLTASTKTGMIPKQIDGFSIEGMEFGPDNKTLYLGFRTPFVPTHARTKALICPILNFEAWFHQGMPTAQASMGAPIELDLGGRGIRSICKNTSNQYVIVAGAFDGSSDFALYHWTGLPTDTPILYQNTDLQHLIPEGIVEVPNPLLTGMAIELINDQGTTDWYNDDTESKDLGTFEFQKFSTSWVPLGTTVTYVSEAVHTKAAYSLYPNPSTTKIHVSIDVQESCTLDVRLMHLSGKLVFDRSYAVAQGPNTLLIDLENITPGSYMLHIAGIGTSMLTIKSSQ